MYTLLLRRPAPLTPVEMASLPGGCLVVRGEGDIVARAVVKAPLPQLLALAVKMGRAAPDARFEFVEEGAVAEAASPHLPPVEAPTARTPWELFEAGQDEAAYALLEGKSLDPEGRDRVRALILGTQPADIIRGCRVSRITAWKSIVQNMRGLVRHTDPRVRLEVALAMGALAGPVMGPVLRPLGEDPNPEVQKAAQAALKVWGM